MRFSTSRHRPKDDYSLLPLTNVVFLLMIFFLLIGRIGTPGALSIKPPESTSDTALSSSTLRIEIAANGQIAVEGEPVRIEQLADTVRSYRTGAAGQPVRLKADGHMEATRVVHVMQILHRTGIEKLRLVTRGS